MSTTESAHDVIVVGGGPAGSTCAAIAARKGLDVLLLEAAKHPRVHIGESLLPGIIPVLDEMGALADVEAAGFTPKTGATHWNWGRTPEWDLWFAETEIYDHAWLVERARFDEILFRAAVRNGARAHENAAAKSVLWDGDRAVGVEWRVRGEDTLRTARAPFVIDATGSAALIAKASGVERALIPGLQHHASWAHFEGAARLPPPHQHQALLIAETSHWTWFFPLSPTLTSVGIVFEEDHVVDADEQRATAFTRALAENARLQSLLRGARQVTPCHNVRDWSYRMPRVAGPGWLGAGDSSGFIDPILSTGVMLAMVAASNAAKSVYAVLRDHADEAETLARYQKAHAALFDDILRLVRFFYQRQLSRDDYFWESKQILDELGLDFKPQQAFLALTSGLVRNLPLDDRMAQSTRDREARVSAGANVDLDAHDPDTLSFVCIRMRHRQSAGPVELFLLIEPHDPGEPALFRTPSWNVVCLAPRLGNDIKRSPELSPHVPNIAAAFRALDDQPGESLAAFFRRTRGPLLETLRAVPLEIIRVFGE